MNANEPTILSSEEAGVRITLTPDKKEWLEQGLKIECLKVDCGREFEVGHILDPYGPAPALRLDAPLGVRTVALILKALELRLVCIPPGPANGPTTGYQAETGAERSHRAATQWPDFTQ